MLSEKGKGEGGFLIIEKGEESLHLALIYHVSHRNFKSVTKKGIFRGFHRKVN
jgi:hypothetical protein